MPSTGRRSAFLPGATLRAYQLLEARAAAGVSDWRVVLVPPATALPQLPALTDPPTPEMQAALATVAWAYDRLEIPITVSGT